MLRKNGMVGLLVAVFLFASSGQASAQTTSLQQALTRMDEIIAQMQALRTEFAALQARVGQQTAVPQVQGAQTSSVGFTEPLEVGATNDDISYIQKLLATDPAIYPDGIVSGYYGPKTVEAIRNLQARFGLSTPGVIGPQTRTILEAFLARYPDANFPENVLQQIPQVPNPQVQGAATTITPTPTLSVSAGSQTVLNNPAAWIRVEFDGGAADIRIRYTDGATKNLLLRADDEDDAVRMIVRHTDLTSAQVRAAMTVEASDDEEESSGDEDEAEEAIEDADDAIEDAEDEIDEADEDGEDVDWAEDTLDEAEDLLEEAEDAFDDGDFDEAIELAEEAEEMAEEAEDRIGEEKGSEPGDSDEIEEIIAKIGDDETEITVEYEDDPDYEFTVEVDETDEDDIIDEVADELDIDDDDVEDLIEFEGRDVEYIEVELYEDDDRAIADVEFENGDEKRYIFDTTDEDDIIEELADRLNLDEDDVEDVIEFFKG